MSSFLEQDVGKGACAQVGLGEFLVGAELGKEGGLTAAIKSSPSVVWHVMNLGSRCRSLNVMSGV